MYAAIHIHHHFSTRNVTKRGKVILSSSLPDEIEIIAADLGTRALSDLFYSLKANIWRRFGSAVFRGTTAGIFSANSWSCSTTSTTSTRPPLNMLALTSLPVCSYFQPDTSTNRLSSGKLSCMLSSGQCGDRLTNPADSRGKSPIMC